MGGGPLGRGDVLELPVGVLQPLQDGQLFEAPTPSSLSNFGYWDRFYIAINQCTIFLNNIDKDKQDRPEEIEMMKAEARFLRAYYYFCLFRQYGPVFLWFDQTPDENIDAKTIDRHTVDQNIEFIESELWDVAQILPTDLTEIPTIDPSTWTGRATKGAALALRSRVLLYAASPLFNGADIYKGQMKNMNGDYLFPQQEDPEKWQKAADAAWDVIQMNKYSLIEDKSIVANGTTITDEDAKFLNAMKSYELVWQNDGTWSSETIWGWWWRTSNKYSFDTTGYDYMGGVGGTMVPALPPNFGFYAGFGGTAPSLKPGRFLPDVEHGPLSGEGLRGPERHVEADRRSAVGLQDGRIHRGLQAVCRSALSRVASCDQGPQHLHRPRPAFLRHDGSQRFLLAAPGQEQSSSPASTARRPLRRGALRRTVSAWAMPSAAPIRPVCGSTRVRNILR